MSEKKSQSRLIKSSLLRAKRGNPFLIVFCIVSIVFFVSFVPSSYDLADFAFVRPVAFETQDDYILQKPQFILSYNSVRLIPNWVGWHLCIGDLGSAKRGNDFRQDTELEEGLYRVKKSDYQFKKYGFDRGHVCPSADRTLTQEDNSQTFLMTNMIPQAPDLNRIVWKALEDFERELVARGNELYIFAGPSIEEGGVSGSGYYEKITIIAKDVDEQNLQISVPSYCWKVIMILPEGENDLSRVDENTQIISVYMPNKQGVHKDATWKEYLVSVDYVEEKTGYDFFAELEDELENLLETKIYE